MSISEFKSDTVDDEFGSITNLILQNIRKSCIVPGNNKRKGLSRRKKEMKIRAVTRKKMSFKKQGKKNPNYGKERKPEIKRLISLSMSGRELSDQHKTNISESKRKSWLVTDPQGIEYQTDNMQKFCELHDLNYTSMSSVNNGRLKKHRGWTCKVLNSG